MDPISAGLQIIGTGLQIWGSFSAADHAKELAATQREVAADEQQINEQKRLQMQFEGRRMQMEIFRNMQRQRAQATAAAVNQGATEGSGLQGGLAEVTNQSLFNAVGVNTNLQFGNTIFGINNDISNKKMQMADIQSELATDQAWASLGVLSLRMPVLLAVWVKTSEQDSITLPLCGAPVR